MGGPGAHANRPAWIGLGPVGRSDLRDQRRAHSRRVVQQRQRGVHPLSLAPSSYWTDLIRYWHRNDHMPIHAMTLKHIGILGAGAISLLLGLVAAWAADAPSPGIPTTVMVRVV